MDLQITIPTIQMYPDGRLDAANAARYAGLATKTLAMMRCSGTGPKFVKRGPVPLHRIIASVLVAKPA